MGASLTSASMLVLALGAHGSAHAANIFLDLDVPTLDIARQAVQQALETRASGEPEYWTVEGLAQGVVIPRRTWRSASGHWCREFEENVQLDGGLKQSTIAVRCRSDDGRWRLPGGE